MSQWIKLYTHNSVLCGIAVEVIALKPSEGYRHCWHGFFSCLGGKLASLEEFKVQKEDLLAKMAALEDALKEQEAGHQEDIYKLERKQVVDKDRYVQLDHTDWVGCVCSGLG